MRLYVISVICSYVMFCIVSAGVYSRTFGIGFATVDVRYGSSAPLILDDISSNFQWYQPKSDSSQMVFALEACQDARAHVRLTQIIDERTP